MANAYEDYMYLDKANDFLNAAHVLINHSSQLDDLDPIGFLSAQSLELALKAYLIHQGWMAEKAKDELGHDIERAWVEARNAGLDIPEQPPEGYMWLVNGHRYPFAYRYPGSPSKVVQDTSELWDLNDYLVHFIEDIGEQMGVPKTTGPLKI